MRPPLPLQLPRLLLLPPLSLLLLLSGDAGGDAEVAFKDQPQPPQGSGDDTIKAFPRVQGGAAGSLGGAGVPSAAALGGSTSSLPNRQADVVELVAVAGLRQHVQLAPLAATATTTAGGSRSLDRTLDRSGGSSNAAASDLELGGAASRGVPHQGSSSSGGALAGGVRVRHQVDDLSGPPTRPQQRVEELTAPEALV